MYVLWVNEIPIKDVSEMYICLETWNPKMS